MTGHVHNLSAVHVDCVINLHLLEKTEKLTLRNLSMTPRFRISRWMWKQMKSKHALRNFVFLIGAQRSRFEIIHRSQCIGFPFAGHLLEVMSGEPFRFTLLTI